MANPAHLNTLGQGVNAWNAWRKQHQGMPDLSGAELCRADLRDADLRMTNLRNANLCETNLVRANLRRADLRQVDLSGADLSGANLRGAHLSMAYLIATNLNEADLSGADLIAANLNEANLIAAHLGEAHLMQTHLGGANLSGSDLSGAHLREAGLSGANLSGANLREADLTHASLVDADLADADLTGCRIYGVSAWNVKLSSGTRQQDLVITAHEPKITVDNIEVAQFIYLMLNNQKLREVIDTITSKAVLILGRFTDARKAILDALRDELRKLNYLPILFDFDKPASRDLTGTVITLANMVRFIVADGTDPKSIPHELATIVPTTIVPVKPILLAGEHEYAMFGDLQRKYHWVLPTHRYECQEQLIADLDLCVIQPAIKKADELRRTVSA